MNAAECMQACKLAAQFQHRHRLMLVPMHLSCLPGNMPYICMNTVGMAMPTQLLNKTAAFQGAFNTAGSKYAAMLLLLLLLGVP